jgi:hypothetical protein
MRKTERKAAQGSNRGTRISPQARIRRPDGLVPTEALSASSKLQCCMSTKAGMMASTMTPLL